MCLAGAGHASGGDAEAHPGFGLLDHVVHGLHHAVHVIAAPVGHGHVGTRVDPFLIVARRGIGGDAVGVEVVVIQYAVKVIVGHQFVAHLHNAVNGALLSWVKNDGGAVSQQPTFVLELLVISGVPVGTCAPSVGVHPRVALHAALVACFHYILQGVVAWIFAASACQVTRPWFDARLIHRVAHRAHLEVHRIEVVVLE